MLAHAARAHTRVGRAGLAGGHAHRTAHLHPPPRAMEDGHAARAASVVPRTMLSLDLLQSFMLIAPPLIWGDAKRNAFLFVVPLF